MASLATTATQTENDESQIRNIISEMANMNGSQNPGRQHMSDSCLFIRPSGNPLTMEAYDEMMKMMMNSKLESSLVSINKIEVDGNMAYACYTTHSKFIYEETENDDVAVFTGVFHKKNGRWQLVHGQRSTGRTPDQELPQF
jgi:ketosteroid isomerase-like protein